MHTLQSVLSFSRSVPAVKCLYLCLCVRVFICVSACLCNAYVMSSTLVTYQFGDACAQTQAECPIASWAICKMHASHIAQRARHIAHPWNSSDALVLCIYVDVAITTCGSCNNERELCCCCCYCCLFLTAKAAASLPPAACLLCDYYKLENNRLSLRTQQAKAK